MTALTHDRNTPRRDALQFSFPVAADAHIFTGAIVVIQPDGYAAPGYTDNGLKAVGIAQETVNNMNGGDGAATVNVRRGCFALKQSDTITLADVGSPCYLVDDQTVSMTDDDETRSLAGIVRDVDGNGVWVEF